MAVFAEVARNPVTRVTQMPARTLVRTWFILLPLLYYATAGHLVPAGSSLAGPAHQVGLLLASIICAGLILKRFDVVFASSLKFKIILASPVLAILSCLWSVQPMQSVVSGTTLLCFNLFAIYLSETYTPNERLDLIMLCGAVALPLSIVLSIAVPSIGAPSGGWEGIFGHKQQCAGTVTLLLVTALHWKPNNALQRFLLPIYIAMCILMIGMSRSRTGWLIAVLALVLCASLWLLQKFPAREALVFMLTILPMAAALGTLAYTLAPVILASVGKDATLSQRTIIWATVWREVIRRPWLGYGYGAFWTGLTGSSYNVVLASGWGIAQAQDGFLDLWLEVGVVGVAILGLMTGRAILDIVPGLLRRTRSPMVRWSAVIIVCNLAYNVGESDIGLVHLPWFLFVLACIALREETWAAAANNPLRHVSPASPARQLLAAETRNTAW